MNITADAIKWKYGEVADTVEDKITAWRHLSVAQPSDRQLIKDVEEYKAFLSQEAKTEIEREEKIEAVRAGVVDKVKQVLGLSDDEFEALKVILKE